MFRYLVTLILAFTFLAPSQALAADLLPLDPYNSYTSGQKIDWLSGAVDEMHDTDLEVKELRKEKKRNVEKINTLIKRNNRLADLYNSRLVAANNDVLIILFLPNSHYRL